MGMTVQTSLPDHIMQAQQEVIERGNLKKDLDCGVEKHLETKPDGLAYFKDRIWIPAVDELRKLKNIRPSTLCIPNTRNRQVYWNSLKFHFGSGNK
ncbi:hypothetical protein E3N88_15535 [Mikania micrantha]|uniref:Uncharacterized protein n=1 Tax=Mikania micrantha TaxID=192012 RepID=A0A5N6NYW8_9ASTR|nr:hypothetical protein E3N88_15535 [Mikania micrantha]